MQNQSQQWRGGRRGAPGSARPAASPENAPLARREPSVEGAPAPARREQVQKWYATPPSRSRKQQMKILERQRNEQMQVKASEGAGSPNGGNFGEKSDSATDGVDSENVEDVEGEEDLCLVCCEPLRERSIGMCNHGVACALCTARMRLLLGDFRCIMCKTELEKVFVTDDANKAFGDFQVYGDMVGPGLVVDSASGMIYDEKTAGEALKEVNEVQKLNCGVEGCLSPGPFPDFNKLRSHLDSEHNLTLCKLCWENRDVFPMEQLRLTKGEHDKHCTRGIDGTAFKGHPSCRFCKQRFYDNDALYDHLKTRHEMCHICQKQGRQYEYYRNYSDLYRHWQKAHFVCTEKECVEAKFNVFSSEVELRGHIISNHPHVRVNRSVPVQFSIKRRGADGSGFEDDGANVQGGGEISGPDSSEVERFDFHYFPGSQIPNGMTVTTALPNTADTAVLSSDAFPELHGSDSATAISRSSVPGRTGYSSRVGMTSAGTLQDPEQFPTLGAGTGSALAATAVPGSRQNFMLALGKKNQRNAPRTHVYRGFQSRDEQDRNAIRMNTMSGCAPQPSSQLERTQTPPQTLHDMHAPRQSTIRGSIAGNAVQQLPADDFPALPNSKQTVEAAWNGVETAPKPKKAGGAANARWDAMQAKSSGKPKQVSLSGKPKPANRKNKKGKQDDLFFFG